MIEHDFFLLVLCNNQVSIEYIKNRLQLYYYTILVTSYNHIVTTQHNTRNSCESGLTSISVYQTGRGIDIKQFLEFS